MIDVRTATLKQLVTEDFRIAAVLEKYSLDFCCRGGITLDEACAGIAVNKDHVVAELHAMLMQSSVMVDASNQMSLTGLIGHIVTVHHGYVRRMIPVLIGHTQKVAAVHGKNHPEVIAIADEFEQLTVELQHHMMKEERILFPYIESLANASSGQGAVSRPAFGSARNPIAMMEKEHQAAGDAMHKIRELSSGYVAPPDACTTFKVTFQELQQFEIDLHRHVHLENNILFPKAIALEEEILSTTS